MSKKIEKILNECKEVELTEEQANWLKNAQKTVEVNGLCWQKGFMGVFHWKVLQWLSRWKNIDDKMKEEVESKAYEEEAKLAKELWEEILLGKKEPTVQIYMAERYAERFLGLI